MRKTKIIATIGPSSMDPGVLEQLIEAGIDCARLNFSHGTFSEHGEIIQSLRSLSQKHGRPLAVLQDLPGIKLRLGSMKKAVQYNHGDEVSLSPEESSDRPEVLPLPQPGVLRNLKPGHLVFIFDGTVCLEVLENNGNDVKTRVRNGGILSSFKGVNLPGVSLDQPVLTEGDKLALKFGVEQGVDWVALSFVGTGEDIKYARGYLRDIGSNALVMAKLERAQGIDNLDSIIEEGDGVMVARGDLGVEIPMERVPLVQKEIVKKAIESAKVSVIATQMLRSMVVSPTPTRAEVSDITNAVLDGCDSILLSDETAVGQYPVEAVRMANTIITEAEKIYPYYKELETHDQTQAIALAASRLTRELRSRPIVVTSTGRAAFEVSRFRPDSNIIVLSHDESILPRLCLGWGLTPVGVVPAERDVAKLVSLLIKTSMNSGLLEDVDVVTIVHGYLAGVSGTTNTIQILDLQEFLSRSLFEPQEEEAH